MTGQAVGNGPAPGWYPDPWVEGGARWWDGRDWTPEALPPPLPAPVPRRHRSATPWVLGGVAVLTVLVVLAALALVGLNAAVESDERYSQDLVTDQTNFPQGSHDGWSVAFADDGLRMSITEPSTYAATGLRSDLQHLALTVTVTFDPVAVAEGAAVGPACLEAPGKGYAFLVDRGGTATLVEFLITDGGLWDAGKVRTFATATLEPDIARGTELTIACSTPPAGATVSVAGRINGANVIFGEPKMTVADFEYEGMLGHTADAAPAVWAFTSIERRGVDDVAR